MKLSTLEQKALKKSAPEQERVSPDDVRRYPGRVVSVTQALDRIQKQGKDLHSACTTPLNKSYQRNRTKVDVRNPEFLADINSDMSNNQIRQKWGVGWRKVNEVRAANEEAR